MPCSRALFLTLLALLLLAGCGRPVPCNYEPEQRRITSGQLHETQTVLAGNVITHCRLQLVSDVLEVQTRLTSAMPGMTTLVLPQGLYRKIGEDEKAHFFNPVSDKGKQATASGYTVTALVLDKRDRRLSLALAESSVARGWTAGFKFLRQQPLAGSPAPADRSISYGGSHGPLLTFVYRDAGGRQRLTHDMRHGTLFRHAGAEIEVLSHDAKTLTCRVLRHPDMPAE